MSRIPVTIDSGSGFCFGVVTAINKAEEQLGQGDLYCLGDIVHNSDEVERLRHKGLRTISHADFNTLRDTRVLLRAHGEPPATYEAARRNSIEIIDATCPVVLQLQRRIHKAWDSIAGQDPATRPQIVIYGKNGHAEVNGLVGQTKGTAIVVESLDDLAAIDFGRDILLYSQTTKSRQGYQTLTEELLRRMEPGHTVEAFDTICRQVSNRADNIKSFAAGHDVVLFVCGAKSSNGKVLYNLCREANESAHMIANASEIQPEWLAGPPRSVGVCGATSTPLWLMEEVRDRAIAILDQN
ncbi:MAG: 4-hydroxy-3-methylbut-2-enyl diphosphate reductase [Clostridium sp.]|nr:4-hydroxy-3-methylbut-2-enyl diphosphate reductase [Clostridium sp.]